MFWNIIEGFSRMNEEDKRREDLKKNFKTAEDLSKKECIKCGLCCYMRSCIPTPTELKKIAEFLGLTVKKTIKKYFCVDRENLSTIYYVKPAGINQLDLLGTFIPADRSFNEGKCIFLDENNLCKIYTVRPLTSIEKRCWEEYEGISMKRVREEWKKDKLENYYDEYEEFED